MLAQIGLIAGPFDPSEEIKDTIDEPNDSQLTFSLVIISITTVCFHITVDKQVLSFTDTLKVGILGQIGPNVGPFCQFLIIYDTSNCSTGSYNVHFITLGKIFAPLGRENQSIREFIFTEHSEKCSFLLKLGLFWPLWRPPEWVRETKKLIKSVQEGCLYLARPIFLI